MTTTTTTLISVLAFLFPWTGVVVSGWSAFNEQCNPYPDTYNSCDPYAYLSCERTQLGRLNDYVCKCSSPEFIWASLVRRCTLRVGSSCFQGPIGRNNNNRYPDCPPSSYCDIRSSYTCKCHDNHIPNADGSACNEGRSLIHSQPDGKGTLFSWLLQLATLLPFVSLCWGVLWSKT